jgi:cytoskeletal protein CcmA (bactofilin family)
MKRSRIKIRNLILVFAALVLVSLLFTVSAAGASDIRTGEQIFIGAEEVINNDLYLGGKVVAIDGTVQGNVIAAGDQITLKGSIEDDVYLAGNTITIDGTIKGDAIVAGQVITLNGEIEGDLMAAGQAVVVNGAVSDDIRMAGEALVLENQAQVTDDVMAAGFSLESKPESRVGGTLNLAGGQALLAGTIDRNVLGGTGSLALSGSVGGDMNVSVGARKPWRPPFIPKLPVVLPDIPGGLTLMDSAQVGGQLTYRSNAEAKISEDAQVAGDTIYQEIPAWEAAKLSPAEFLVSQLRHLVTLGLLGCLLLWSAPNWTQNLAETIQVRPFASLGWGIVACLAVPLAGIAIAIITALLFTLLVLTLRGIAFPILGLGTLSTLALFISFGTIASFVPKIVLSLLGGRWLSHKLHPNSVSNRFIPFFFGLVILVILTAIPILGEILSLLILFLGLGALWLWGSSRFHRPFLMDKPAMEG